METEVFSLSMNKLMVGLYQAPCLSNIHRLKSILCVCVCVCVFPRMWNKEGALQNSSGAESFPKFYNFTSK